MWPNHPTQLSWEESQEQDEDNDTVISPKCLAPTIHYDITTNQQILGPDT